MNRPLRAQRPDPPTQSRSKGAVAIHKKPPPARRLVDQGRVSAPQKGPAPVPGEWLYTTRPGSEVDLIEELTLMQGPHKGANRVAFAGRVVAPSVVAVSRTGKGKEGPPAPAFARQGFEVAFLLPFSGDRKEAVTQLCGRLLPLLGQRPAALHVFSPDSDEGNRLSQEARSLHEALSAALVLQGVNLVKDGPTARGQGGLLAQVCLLSSELLVAGVGPALHAQSLAPGGRLRFHVDKEAPARSAMKLGEAFAWLEREPEPGDVCVDLGAAPGGWTYLLWQKRAHVVAIDPGRLSKTLAGKQRIEHLQISAFSFVPEEPADWLFCDMAWRPLEVAALLAKWGRQHHARFLLANIKLPMRKRAEMLARVREIIESGGWTDFRARQLYHDRDEVTVAAWRGFGGDARPPKRR